MKPLATSQLLGARQAALAQAEADVLEHRQPGEERVALEHHAAVGARAFDAPAVEQHLAGGRLVEPGDDAQQRALAAARGAEDGDEVVLGHLQVGGLQRQRRRAPASRRKAAAHAADRKDVAHDAGLARWSREEREQRGPALRLRRGVERRRCRPAGDRCRAGTPWSAPSRCRAPGARWRRTPACTARRVARGRQPRRDLRGGVGRGPHRVVDARPRAASRRGCARPGCVAAATASPASASDSRCASVRRELPVAWRMRSPRCSAGALQGTNGSGRPASVHDEPEPRVAARGRNPFPHHVARRERRHRVDPGIVAAPSSASSAPLDTPTIASRSGGDARLRQQPAARRLQRFQRHVFERERQRRQVGLAAAEVADAEHRVAARSEQRRDRARGEQAALRAAEHEHRRTRPTGPPLAHARRRRRLRAPRARPRPDRRWRSLALARATMRPALSSSSRRRPERASPDRRGRARALAARLGSRRTGAIDQNSPAASTPVVARAGERRAVRRCRCVPSAPATNTARPRKASCPDGIAVAQARRVQRDASRPARRPAMRTTTRCPSSTSGGVTSIARAAAASARAARDGQRREPRDAGRRARSSPELRPRKQRAG